MQIKEVTEVFSSIASVAACETLCKENFCNSHCGANGQEISKQFYDMEFGIEVY
jgi:hypothetical protein